MAKIEISILTGGDADLPAVYINQNYICGTKPKLGSAVGVFRWRVDSEAVSRALEIGSHIDKIRRDEMFRKPRSQKVFFRQYCQGWDRRRYDTKATVNDNPHERGSIRWHSWLCGWEDCEEVNLK